MTSWRPKTDLEQEIVSLQPEHNFIYGDLTDAQKKLQNGYHSRPPAHLEFIDRKSKTKTNSEKQNEGMQFNSLNALRTVYNMVGMKPFGMSANVEDLNDFENRDRETVAMIRHCGMGPSADMLLNEKTTIPTLPLRKGVHVVRNGQKKFPVLGDEFFEVKSTRMRNAELLKNISSIRNELNGIQINERKLSPETITALNEEEIMEPTEAEITAKKDQEFLAAFPTLGKDKNKVSNKTNKKLLRSPQKRSPSSNQNINRKSKELIPSTKKLQEASISPDKFNLNVSSSTSPNSSVRSQSSYISFENDDSNNSSTYFSANETLVWTRTNQNASNSNSYASVVQSNVNPDRISAAQRRYYTPKEVYDSKRHLK